MSASLAVRLARLPAPAREEILSRFSTLERAILAYTWRGFMARPEQTFPLDDSYDVGLVLAGRAFGKTKLGGNWVREQVETGRMRRIALIGPDEGEIRKYMIEGVSGILKSSPPWCKPEFYSSKGNMRLVWPNGAEAECHSAEEAEYRGPNLDGFWWDEPAKCRWLVPLWANLQLSLRGSGFGMAPPQGIFTGTPLPLQFFRDLRADPRTIFRTGSSLNNRDNLPKKYVAKLEKMGDTRHAQQERDGVLLDDETGSLFPEAVINAHRIAHPDDMPRRFVAVVISIDPADTVSDRSDETGIIALGLDTRGHVYVLDDRTGKHSPKAWAEAAFELYRKWEKHADRVTLLAEKNRGGDMVRRNLQAYEETEHLKAGRGGAFRPTPVELVRSEESKERRAQPVSQLYADGRVHHVGLLAALEKEMAGWIPGVTRKSPNGLDALVHGVHHLLLDAPLVDHGALLMGMSEASQQAAGAGAAGRLTELDELFGPRAPDAWPRDL